MRRATLAVVAVAVAAATLGALAGWRIRRKARSANERPAAVEAALRALDGWERRGDRAMLVAARDLAGPPAAQPSPWREELELVAIAASGDDEALWRFAATPPPAPPRARALLRLSRAAVDPAMRQQAAARLRADYPSSWAAGDGVR